MKAIIIALFWVFALGTFAPLIKINGYVLSKDADSEEKFNDNEKVDENKDDSLPRSSPVYSIDLRFMNSGPSVVVKWTQNGNPKEAHIPSGYAYRQSIFFHSATQPSAMQFRIYEAGTNKVVKIFHVTPTLQRREKVIKIGPDPTATCEDKGKICLVWKQRIGCDNQFMKAFCPKTCGLCRQEDEDIVTENDDSLTNSEENYIGNAKVDETKDDSHPTDSEENYIENAKVDETKDDSHPIKNMKN